MKKGDYISLRFSHVKQEDTDFIIAMLADTGFEGFEESENYLTAYIGKKDYEEAMVKELADRYSLFYEVENLPMRNWNAVWENNFEPVVIDDFVAIRAHFHQPVTGVQHDIIITPKMSFGTGHHATTTMMIQQMRHLDFKGKTVFDFGTGTGILSILAEKLGAADILAVDNDEWSIENSRENIEQNDCHCIRTALKNNAYTNEFFDVILANINRNVILENFSFLSAQLKTGGDLLISGLLAEDEKIIVAEATRYQILLIKIIYRLQWISLLFGR